MAQNPVGDQRPTCTMYIHCTCSMMKVSRESFTYLHNEKVRIVDIQLNWTKQVLNSSVVCIASIDQILVSASNHNLQCRHTVHFHLTCTSDWQVLLYMRLTTCGAVIAFESPVALLDFTTSLHLTSYMYMDILHLTSRAVHLCNLRITVDLLSQVQRTNEVVKTTLTLCCKTSRKVHAKI